ncbi:hypothetical protein RCO28_36660 [Streptomyces sp. LHD-70]|uniref:hypothetical protein n=1 Tax=Streptomyces sp. LHD-70 TaxID=3072140 RepID=UPI00280C8BDA|nr:hypothetical protein [Streptomyces sp. LHD-70]MDQ8707959.1 hypothetical protein [Streptomyces sp. LHD-70]
MAGPPGRGRHRRPCGGTPSPEEVPGPAGPRVQHRRPSPSDEHDQDLTLVEDQAAAVVSLAQWRAHRTDARSSG